MPVVMLILASYLLEGLLNVFVLQQSTTSYIKPKSDACNIGGDEFKNMSSPCRVSLLDSTDTQLTIDVVNGGENTSASGNTYEGNQQQIERDDKVTEEFHSNATQNFQLFDPEWNPIFSNNNLSVPNIIMNLYQSLANKDFGQNFDLIKCLHIAEYSYITNGIIIKFVLDGVQNVEHIIGAELYMYRFSQRFERISTDSNIVRLYQILPKDEIDPKYGKQNVDVHELLGVIYISAYDQGWQIFNVEKSLEKKMKGDRNLNFLISVTDSWGNIIDPKQFDLAVTKSSNSPLLVLRQFSNKVDLAVTKNSNQTSTFYENRSEFQPQANPSIIKTESTITLCTRHNFYIDFNNGVFKNFIIHPKGLMLYKCAGICELQFSNNFTDHARLLDIIQKSNGTLPEHYCVPNNYLPATLVFYDHFGNIVIKKYYDMIVDSCGCR